MTGEKRFSNLFATGEAAHAFETHVRGAALEAGLSVDAGGIDDLGLPGNRVRLVLSGAPDALERFAAELHDGVRLAPDD